jgi:hypothetical protein
LQKYRFFARFDKSILSFSQSEEDAIMNNFWRKLSRVAMDQLFTGGYLSTATVSNIAAKAQAQTQQDRGDCNSRNNGHGGVPWPRLANFR